MSPWIAKDAAFFTLEAKEHGESDAYIEMSEPVVFGICGREGMMELIGGEVIYRCLGSLVERGVGAGANIEDAEVGKGGKTESAVKSISGSHAIRLGVLESGIFVSYLAMRHEVEFEL